MKKVYTFILSGAAILAVVACNKEVQVEDNSQNNEPVYETLSVKVGAETKVTLETGAAKSAFEEGDKIAVWTDAGEFQECAVNGEGKITVDVSQPRSNYAVYYNGTTLPSYSAETLSIALPSSYAYADVADDKNPVPMVAKNVSSDPADMTFYAVGTLFRVTVKAIPSDATSLVFQFPGNKVNGTFPVTNPGNSTPSISTMTPGIGEDKITINLPDAPHATEMVLNIPLPTGDYDDVFITPVSPTTKVAAVRHINAGGYNARRAYGKQLTATLVSFTVSYSNKVIFAPGNLQYQANSNTWRFADHQYDMVADGTGSSRKGNVSGSDNRSISSSYSGWIDLFGWGTSGWDGMGSENGRFPYSVSKVDEDYGPYKVKASLTGSYANGDWGVYNNINSYTAGTWRLPSCGASAGEWKYLLETRDNANNKRSFATVCDTQGLIILPDSFDDPKTNNGNNSFVPNITNSFASNDYDNTGWAAMESAGAIFLPKAGYRAGASTYNNLNVIYWSSTHRTAVSAYDAYGLFFNGSVLSSAGTYVGRAQGNPVRLIREL